MATSWRPAAAAVFCVVCVAAAALESSRRAPIVRGGPAPAVAGLTAVVHLRMPDLPVPLTALSRRGQATHAVVAGDTLWAIAASAGVGVEALAVANGLSEMAILRLGRVLTIPSPGAPVRARVSAPRAATFARAPVAARPAAPTAAPLPSRSSAWHLALLWPSGGVVTSRFGWRVHPIFGGREFHTGMDIATRYGSPVVAARAGIVRFVGWKSGYGRIVMLAHDGGIETAYSHLSAALVSPGQQVARGQTIGRIGNSGWSTGPHLFFEVRRNGVPLDPARYLN